MPCADKDNVMNSVKAKVQLTKAASQQENPQQDACSPFCQCNCCAGFSVNHTIAAVTIIPSFESNALSCFLPSAVRELALPVWQPPQLV